MIDILDNTYNPLINEIFAQIQKGVQNGSGKDEIFDKFHFFKLSSFMIQIQRMKAYDEHNALKKIAFEKAKAEQSSKVMEDGGKSLFQTGQQSGKNLGSKSKPVPQKIQVPKVPFEINIASIGASLQL